MLGGKSVNGNPVIFPYNNSVPYHIYFKLINTKDHGVPQNRERVFIVGIRDDEDNNFRWPIEDPQDKKLIDIVEQEVSEKYFLSEDAIKKLDNTDHLDTNRVANTLRCSGGGSVSKKHSFDVIRVGNINPSGNGMNGNVFDEQGISPILTTNKGEGIKIKSKSVCIPVLTPDRPNKRQNGRRFKEDDEPSFIITTQDRHGIYDGYRLRRLTPRECFRLQDFPDSFDFSVVSDTQAYKQAGNSITVRVLEKILNNLL
jgi:DNA (cytosine-5)-methyltransferase 1